MPLAPPVINAFLFSSLKAIEQYSLAISVLLRLLARRGRA
jgi:hypothetical protein